jgi:hypothetical protein
MSQMLLDRMFQLSIRVVRDSEFVVTMNAQEYVHFEVKFDLNHPFVPIEEDILNIISALKLFEIIEDDLEISEVAIPKCKKQWQPYIHFYYTNNKSMLVNSCQGLCV